MQGKKSDNGCCCLQSCKDDWGEPTNNMTTGVGNQDWEFIIKSKSEKQKPLYVYISKMLDNQCEIKKMEKS